MSHLAGARLRAVPPRHPLPRLLLGAFPGKRAAAHSSSTGVTPPAPAPTGQGEPAADADSTKAEEPSEMFSALYAGMLSGRPHAGSPGKTQRGATENVLGDARFERQRLNVTAGGDARSHKDSPLASASPQQEEGGAPRPRQTTQTHSSEWGLLSERRPRKDELRGSGTPQKMQPIEGRPPEDSGAPRPRQTTQTHSSEWGLLSERRPRKDELRGSGTPQKMQLIEGRPPEDSPQKDTLGKSGIPNETQPAAEESGWRPTRPPQLNKPHLEKPGMNLAEAPQDRQSETRSDTIKAQPTEYGSPQERRFQRRQGTAQHWSPQLMGAGKVIYQPRNQAVFSARWSPDVAEEAKKLVAESSFSASQNATGIESMLKSTSPAEAAVRSAALPPLDPSKAQQLAEMYARTTRYIPIPRELRPFMKPQPRSAQDEQLNILRNNAGLFLARFPTYNPDWTWFRPWKNGCPALSPDELQKHNDVDLDLMTFEGGDYSADTAGFPAVDAKGARILEESGLGAQLENINRALNANPTLTTRKRCEMKRRILESVGALPPTPVPGKMIDRKKIFRYWRPRHHIRPNLQYFRSVPHEVMDKVESKRKAMPPA